MITVYTSNSTMELAEVKFNTCMFIDYDGNEYIILDYFREKKLYQLCHDGVEQMRLIYVDNITKVDLGRERTILTDAGKVLSRGLATERLMKESG